NTDSYYMKIFSKKMPDLNWDNPDVRAAIFDVARFYLDLGVDGFRLDAIAHLARDTSYQDSTYKTEADGTVLDYNKFSNLPKMFDYLLEFKRQVLSKYDCVTVGEVGGGVSPLDSLRYSGYDQGSINMVFNFDTAWENGAFASEGKSDEEIVTNVIGMKHNFARWFNACYQKSWLPLYWDNHDHPRVLSQYGSVKYRKASAKMLAMTLLYMYGTPFLFNGEEIGMSNVVYDQLEDFKDVSDQNFIKEGRHRFTSDLAMVKYLQRTSRTNGHAPMQWTNGKNAGFTSGSPWLKINPNYPEVNVESQMKDPDSILNFYKKAIKLRKDKDILDFVINTAFVLVQPEHQDVFSYIHTRGHQSILLIANFRDREVAFDTAHLNHIEEVLLSNYDYFEIRDTSVKLPPFGALLLKVTHE
ncbi:MAG TPA: alpha-amylase family glycosyl hydrolase, partial [Bacilli bacterium]|nr:alpha-amylase family glycosyl hydrolase [Bacilli bacterium]